MKVTIKLVDNKKFEIEVPDATATTAQLKQLISASNGFDVAAQKLILSGKIMDDAKTLADYGWQENGFIVCMVSKKAAGATSAASAPPAATPAAKPSSAATSSTSSANAPPAAPVKPVTAGNNPPTTPNSTPSTVPSLPAQSHAQQPSAAAAAPPSAPAGPPRYKESDVSLLKEMGFDNDAEVRRALFAAFGNLDRAAEYLMSGIPAGVATSESAAPSAAPPSSAAPSSSAATPSAPSAAAATTPVSTTTPGGDPLAELRSHPSLNALKRQLREDPTQLGSILAQLNVTAPHIVSAINANRQAFLALLNEPIASSAGGGVLRRIERERCGELTERLRKAEGDEDEDMEGDEGEMEFEDDEMGGQGGDMAEMIAQIQQMTPEQRAHVAASMGVPPEQLQAVLQMMQSLPPAALQQLLGAGGGGGRGEGGVPPGATVVRLTETEMAAVNRLQELGFSKHACVEAYFACDKNEELAADLLFRTATQDDYEQQQGGGGGGGQPGGGQPGR